MSNTEGLPRRSFLAGASATVAMGMLPPALSASGDGNLLDLSAVEAVVRMSRGDISAEQYARVLLERCALYRQLWAQQHRHMDGRGPRGAVTPRLVRGD